MALYELSAETEHIIENIGYTLVIAVALPWVLTVVLNLDLLIDIPTVLGITSMVWAIIVFFIVCYPLVRW